MLWKQHFKRQNNKINLEELRSLMTDICDPPDQEWHWKHEANTHWPMVRLGMEDRTLSVSDDQRSPIRWSVCCGASLSDRWYAGASRYTTSSETQTALSDSCLMSLPVWVGSSWSVWSDLCSPPPGQTGSSLWHHEGRDTVPGSADWMNHEPHPHLLDSWCTKT